MLRTIKDLLGQIGYRVDCDGCGLADQHDRGPNGEVIVCHDEVDDAYASATCTECSNSPDIQHMPDGRDLCPGCRTGGVAKPSMPTIAAAAPAECVCNWPEGCVCLREEKALRFFSGPGAPPMTVGQREECLVEIEQVEGYERADYETADDATLAEGVLNAWRDYSRDKGLL